jgi:methyl-accepting chemotaxis protein
MKLEMKLALSTGTLVTAMFVSAFFAYGRIRDASALSDIISQKQLPVMLSARDVRTSVLQSVNSLDSYILFGLNESTAAEYRRLRAAALQEAEASTAKLVEVRGRFNLGEDAARIDRLQNVILQLRQVEEKVEQLNESKQPEGIALAYTMLQKDGMDLTRDAVALTGEISTSQQVQIGAEASALEHANSLTVITLWSTTFLGAIMGALIAFVIARRIADGVALVANRANAISGGDLTGAELQLETSDQIGELAEAMNRMQAALGTIIGTVVDTAGSLTGSAASMRSASDQMHRRIDQQSQQTQQAATAMQEMSASIAEVSRHTQSAAETARSAAQTARDGGAIVKQMLGSMHQIATAVSETSSTVGLLGEDSKRISQIVTVIDEIARKTNLLALNAAIEAARAGDQGRGFAVVAGEVRRLAESTAQATGEIANMIQEIQDRTKTAIASMESGTGTVRDGVVTTTQAGEALERIIGMAERVDRMITQIAIAASQQATAADQSSASLDSIHSLSDENLTEMATTAAGIEILRGTAVTLEKQVDRFHVMNHTNHAGKWAA